MQGFSLLVVKVTSLYVNFARRQTKLTPELQYFRELMIFANRLQHLIKPANVTTGHDDDLFAQKSSLLAAKCLQFYAKFHNLNDPILSQLQGILRELGNAKFFHEQSNLQHLASLTACYPGITKLLTADAHLNDPPNPVLAAMLNFSPYSPERHNRVLMGVIETEMSFHIDRQALEACKRLNSDHAMQLNMVLMRCYDCLVELQSQQLKSFFNVELIQSLLGSFEELLDALGKEILLDENGQDIRSVGNDSPFWITLGNFFHSLRQELTAKLTFEEACSQFKKDFPHFDFIHDVVQAALPQSGTTPKILEGLNAI